MESTHPRPLAMPRWRAVTYLVLFLAAPGGLYLWQTAAERHSIRDMPPAQRHAAYESAMQTFRTLCVGPEASPALSARCREQASLVRQFPECDAACRDLLDWYRTEPHR
jgi:hypothetical protein